jgi:apolipoprotein N-acyltransferase
MLDTESLRRLRIAFAAQFEEKGGTVTFRRRGKGEPVAISVWERDALTYDFNRRMGVLYVGMIVLLIVILLAAAASGILLHARLTLIGVIAVMGPAVFLYSAAQAWLWDAPRRQIAARQSEIAGSA